MKKYPQIYQNLYDILAHSADKFPGKTAVIDEKTAITYGCLAENAGCLAAWLKSEFHIKRGERVGLLFVNCVEFYIAFYAVMKLGAIAVLVNTKMQSEEIAFTLRDTGTQCLIMNERWLGKVRDIVSELKIDRIMTEQESKDKAVCVHMASMDRVLKTGAIVEDIPSEQGEDITAVILHTSGTTGKPKGIMISHRNIMEASYGYQEVQGLNENDISVLSVPVFHILGLSCVSTLFIYMGATLVVFEKFDSNKVLTAIEKYHATHFHSVPAVYIKLLQEADRSYDLSSLRVAVCGGAIISEEYKDMFCAIAPNASFRIAYGLTETAGSGVLSFDHRKPGRAVPNCRISVLDGMTGELLDYGEGEAVCESPMVTTRVWGCENTGDGRLYTGDIIRKEENGDIFILDRIKDVINRGGEKIFPSTIETALLRYRGVEDAVVFPVKDDLYGEVPAAVLIEKEGEKISLKEIETELPKQIGKFELPRYIEIWKRDKVPVTGNGKVRKRRLREIFEQELFG